MLARSEADAELHAQYAGLISSALEDIHLHHTGAWSKPRPFTRIEPRKRKRKRRVLEDVDVDEPPSAEYAKDQATEPANLPEELLQSLVQQPRTYSATAQQTAVPGDRTSQSEGVPDSPTAWTNVFTNPSQTSAHLILTRTITPPSMPDHPLHFTIPPCSSFLLGDCTDSTTFHAILRSSHAALASKFDFILLDPPWPNKSVLRKQNYSTAASMPALRSLLSDMGLSTLLAEDGVVGVWTTHKRAVRDFVLGVGGFFEGLGIDLVEEWVWVKVTTSGEPVVGMESVWRRPYEVLLLGRRSSSRSRVEVHGAKQEQKQGTGRDRGSGVRRRVVAAVPDLHSRKMCLKEVLEGVGLLREGQRGLEVFARHLVKGWWSWGDEVLKFSWDGCWRKGCEGEAHRREEGAEKEGGDEQ